jgi:hypothetical protein
MAYKGQKIVRFEPEMSNLSVKKFLSCSRGFTETIWSKYPVFSKKVCIKECLEVEETQAIWCSDLENFFISIE